MYKRQVLRRVEGRDDVVRALNWPDRELADAKYWSADRLHMNSAGHHRVAARVLHGLGFEPPSTWWSPTALTAGGPAGLAYYREFVGPWVRRRVTRTSSGDGRAAKYPDWVERVPHA